MPTYTISQAAAALHVSPSTLRSYCKSERFARFLSASATPPKDTARVLTSDDVKTLQYIAAATKTGATLSQVEERLSTGELADWSPEPPEPEESTTSALVLAQQFSLRLEESAERERALLRELGDVKSELAAAQALLSERSHPWWRRLLGT